MLSDRCQSFSTGLLPIDRGEQFVPAAIGGWLGQLTWLLDKVRMGKDISAKYSATRAVSTVSSLA
jgi:hypothetical protein